jgi:hypothetical protein
LARNFFEGFTNKEFPRLRMTLENVSEYIFGLYWLCHFIILSLEMTVSRFWHCVFAILFALCAVPLQNACAQAEPSSVSPVSGEQDAETTLTLTDSSNTSQGGLADYFAQWANRVAAARATQPTWTSPIATGTAILEERLRVDASFQSAGNGADTWNVPVPNRGLQLIVGETEEIEIGGIPYFNRTTPSGAGNASGIGDWPFLRFKQRLASSPESGDNYIVSILFGLQAPTGISAFSNDAYTLLPTLAFGKGFGNFIIQGTFGAVIPTAHQSIFGTQITGNIAFQYRFERIFWPELEVNWTNYQGGLRSGANQVFLTPGIVIGRFRLSDRVGFTFGFGYQSAIAPPFRASPLLPTYNHAWLFTTRLSF